MASKRAYSVNENGDYVTYRLEWGVRQYKSFASEEEAEGHLKTLTEFDLKAGWRTSKIVTTILKTNRGNAYVQPNT